MANKYQYSYFTKITSVIKSCITMEQLDNARKWFDRVTYINNMSIDLTLDIVKAYKSKRRQIQNGLATKYKQSCLLPNKNMTVF